MYKKVLFFFVLLFFFTAVSSDETERLLSFEKEREELDLKRKQIEILLNSAKKKENELLSELSRLSTEEKELEEEITFVRTRINELGNNLDTLMVRRDELENILSEKYPVISDYLIHMYKRKNWDYSRIFFDSGSFNTFIRKYKIMKKLIREELIFLDSVKSDLQEQIIVSQRIESQRRELQNFAVELEIKEKEYVELVERQERLLVRVRNEKEDLEKKYNKIHEDFIKITQIIQYEIEKETQTSEQPIKQPDKEKEETSAAKELKFSWPVSATNPILIPFGQQYNEYNTLFNNQGIDIQIKENDWVIAAEEGNIAYIGSMPGLGKIIIIRHQDDYTSVYTYLDDIFVRIGQKIKVGEKLATGVINADNREKSVIHFEIRKRGEPVNPEKLLIIRR
ncbi:MAG: peptidoglycan DD-metalloendopeptidase family protein [Candidatus Muiribacteriota bacterium]